MKKYHFLFFCMIDILIPAMLSAQTDTVRMMGMSFRPAQLNVKPGTTVVWLNVSDNKHTTTSGTECKEDGKWNSGLLDKGQSFKHTFTTEGNYPYFCIPHCLSGMKGMIHVSGSNKVAKKESPTKMPDKNQTETSRNDISVTAKADTLEKYQELFSGTRVVSGQSVETLGAHLLDVRITHRFDNLTSPGGGFHAFYGLDNIRNYRLAIEYGMTDRLMLGISRIKGDFIFGIEQAREFYELMAKYRLLRQSTDGKMPFSLSIFGNSLYSAMPKDTTAVSEANFGNMADRFSFSLEALIAKKLGRKLSLQLMPVYIRRNWVTGSDEANLFALGAGGRWALSKTVSIVADYYFPFSPYRQQHTATFHNPLGIGMEVNTGGHVFTINFSNSTGIVENEFIPYTTSSWLKGQFRLGFTISRKFNLKKS